MTNSDIQKEMMIKALEANRGIVTKACAIVDIARQTHYRWLTEDPEYKAACDEVGESAIDAVEGKLYDLIDKGDTTATIFYLKTKGKKRGYIEKTEVDATLQGQVNIVFEPAPGCDPITPPPVADGYDTKD